MADYAPVNGADGADTVTFTAGGTITGGQCLKFSAADQVQPADANAATYAGIAGHDAASGAPVTVFTGAGIVHETAAAAVTAAGALVYAGSATAGEVGATNTAGFTPAIGVALRATTTVHGVLRWKSLVG